jgi:hypothetical protein
LIRPTAAAALQRTARAGTRSPRLLGSAAPGVV